MEITHHNKKTFVTDSLQDTRADVVFPIFEDESIYFADHIQVRPNEVVLDIGTGSGILAITATKRAKHVTALDIQSRALKFASFNAHLNGVENKITFVKSDGLAKISGRFDVALFNPPFNPAPKNLVGKIFSHGGDDGTYIARKVFAKLPQVIEPKGRLQMITFSLGKNNKPLIFDLVEKFLHKRNPEIHYTHLYPPVAHKKIGYFQKIFGPKYKAWYQKFDNYPQIFYIFSTVRFDSSRAGFYEKPSKIHFRQSQFSGSRESRIRRLRCIYRGICK